MQTVADLAALHEQGLDLAGSLPAADLNRQYHPDLSPLGWHIGHCACAETYWLRGVVLGEPQPDAGTRALFFPENCRKERRAGAMPPQDELLAWAARVHADNRATFAAPPRRARAHAWLQSGYLVDFLCQHYAQHLETMAYVLAQRALAATADGGTAAEPAARAPGRRGVALAAGGYTIGTDAAEAYDNERPAHAVELGAAHLGRHPVTNAEFLAFVHDGGYSRHACWSTAGWRWRARHGIDAPAYWRRDDAGALHEVTPRGPGDLDGDAPVTGVSYWEAEAFARWAGARLPHEYEWEALARAGALFGLGQAWEWCADPLHPYPGFRAYPYEGYSMPWFDGNHCVLRGASTATRDAVRRLTFRNFHEPGKRHVFAGLRLAW